MKFDLVIFGGGTSGIAAAYIAAKYGLNTLLVEKSDVLGGSVTRGLVVPSMKVDTSNINTEFFNDLKIFADEYSARHTYIDSNEAWFNPELLKIVFDDMLATVNCEVLFNSYPVKCSYDSDNKFFSININHNTLSLYIETKYIIDATGNAEIFKILKYDLQEDDEMSQTPNLRFILSGINIKKFADWLEKFDRDRNVTTIERASDQTYLSTAYTWDSSRNWALKPIFDKAVKDGVLEYEDTAYFQVFSMPSMPDSLNFNAPRILLDANENINDPFVYSRALKQGRERIYRLYEFCKTYLKGFENSYISHISDMLGVRESYRIKGKYTVTVDDIINPKNFDNIAFTCDYPVDIHSSSKNKDKLMYVKQTYNVPVEALISDCNDRLYAAGRNVSAEFEAQAAIRTQMSCFSMGEAAAKDIFYKINSDLIAKK